MNWWGLIEGYTINKGSILFMVAHVGFKRIYQEEDQIEVNIDSPDINISQKVKMKILKLSDQIESRHKNVEMLVEFEGYGKWKATDWDHKIDPPIMNHFRVPMHVWVLRDTII